MKTYNWSAIPNLIVRNGWCHARVERDGKQHWRSLRIEADAEGKNAEFVRESLRAFKLELARNDSKILEATKRRRTDTSTFAQIFTAYRGASAGRDIKDDTVESNIAWLGVILRTVNGEFFDIENARAHILTSDLLATFQERRIAAVKQRAEERQWPAEEYEQAMKSAKNTVKSIIQQARSVFAKDLLQSRHYRNLTLPDLYPFMAFRAEGSTVSAFVRPASEVWSRILADLPALKSANIALWYAFQLGVNCGLRRGSARSARWSWCKQLESGEAEMEVRRAKGGHYFIRLPAEVWNGLLANRASTDYIIPLASEEERDEAVNQLVQWLRERGLDNRNPFHTLRKIFGDAIVRAHGLTEGQNSLGHSKQDLTHAVYAEHRSTKGVKVV